jgi:hypothetical protein
MHLKEWMSSSPQKVKILAPLSEAKEMMGLLYEWSSNECS